MTIKIVVNNENQSASISSETLILEDVLITIGSAGTANVRLSGSEVAPEQAVIVNENGQSLFVNQVKGTILNGAELDKGFPHELKTGDQIRIGSYLLVVELGNHFSAPEHILPVEKKSTPVVENLIPDINNFENEDDKHDLSQNTFQDSLPVQTNQLEVETFADILSSLRKEEDQFYFQLTEADNSKRRLLIQSDEIILGWDVANDIFLTNKETDLDLSQAAVRKDWNGVTIYPKGNEAILLNGTLLEAGSRLKNGDKMIFSRQKEVGTHTVTLVFCEPAALVELNAILPQQLLSNALEANQSGEITVEIEPEEQLKTETQSKNTAASHHLDKERSPYYFRYFTLVEIIIMIVATIFTAILTYILLDFS